MAIRFECGNCGEPHRLHPSHAGRTIFCKRCDERIDVPERRSRRPREFDDRDDEPSQSNAMTWLLLGGIAAALLAAGGIIFAFRGHLIGRGWQPEKRIADQLEREVGVEGYALTLPDDFEHVGVARLARNGGTSVDHEWRGPAGVFSFGVVTHPDFVGETEPAVQVGDGAFHHRGRGPVFVYSDAEVDRGTVNRLKLTRIRVDHDVVRASMGPHHPGGPRQVIYVIFDEDRCLVMNASTRRSLESDEFALLEGIARTVRRVKPDENLPPPGEARRELVVPPTPDPSPRLAGGAPARRPIVPPIRREAVPRRPDPIPARPAPEPRPSPPTVVPSEPEPEPEPEPVVPLPPLVREPEILVRQPLPPAEIPDDGPEAETPDGWSFNLPLSSSAPSRFALSGPAGRYVVLDDGGVYDLGNGRRAGRVDDGDARWNLHALAPDGSFFAYVTHPVDDDVQIVSTTGGPPITIPKNPGDITRALAFLDSRHVLISFQVGGDARNEIRDATTGELLRSFEFDHAFRNPAISPDGRHAMDMQPRELRVVDLDRGRVVKRMEPPPNTKSFPFSPAGGGAYSPDGSEFAALNRDRFTVWSTSRGRIVLDKVVPEASKGVYKGNPVAWLPDGSGWLLNGRRLFDRESREVVWRLDSGTTYDFTPVAVVDESTLGMAVPHPDARRKSRFAGIPIPRNEIDAALGRFDVERTLEPGGDVSIFVKVGNVRFSTEEEVRRTLERILTERLTAAGLEVVPESSHGLSIEYSERPGEQRHVVTGPRREKTGDLLRGTIAEATVAVHREGRTQPAWRRTVRVDHGLVVEGEATEEALRERTFEEVGHRLDRLPLPFADTPVMPLPIVSELRKVR